MDKYTCNKCREDINIINECISVPGLIHVITTKGYKTFHDKCYGLGRIRKLFGDDIDTGKTLLKDKGGKIYKYEPSWAEWKKWNLNRFY